MLSNKLNHIAFIMDGNRRWAKKVNIDLFSSYMSAVKTMESIINYCVDYNIVNYITFYSLSCDNLNRSEDQIEIIVSILDSYLDDCINNNIINLDKVRIVFLGDYHIFGDEIVKKIEYVQNMGNPNSLVVLIALNYGGKQDIIQATQRLCHKVLNNELAISDITTTEFSKYLCSFPIPDPDILIRTGGHVRLSNFYLWQLSYTELFFSNKLWNEYSIDDLSHIIEQYQAIKRNFGV